MKANDMIMISRILMYRINIDFSCLSANCPAVAENKKKGQYENASA